MSFLAQFRPQLKVRSKRGGGPEDPRPRSHSSYAIHHMAATPDTETGMGMGVWEYGIWENGCM